MSRSVISSSAGAVSTNVRLGMRVVLGKLVVQVIIYFGLGPWVRDAGG